MSGPYGVPAATGLFVAFEGGEGAGKSTQVGVAACWLRGRGRTVRETREPGATPAGQRIREIVLDPGSALVPLAEALLYAADRAHHVATVVRPNLAAGHVVLTDRYIDSTLAYQGAGRALGDDQLAALVDLATGGLRPDLTILLDVDPAVGLTRAAGRRHLDRIEGESLDFHERVRAGFLSLASAAPDRYLVLAADDAVDETAAAVRRRLATMLAEVTE